MSSDQNPSLRRCSAPSSLTPQVSFGPFDTEPKRSPRMRRESLELTSRSGTQSPSRATPATKCSRNGSRTAWSQVLVGHLVLFNSFGLIQSFGIFQPAYETLLNQTPFAISWIGSVHIFLVYFIGSFSGRALDAGYYRTTLGIGLMLPLVGLLIAGNSEAYWMAFLFHGVFQGVGHGLMFCPAVTNTALWFGGKNKMLAMSLTGCGGATGGIVFPAIARATMQKLGIAWTLRIMACVVLFNSVVIFLFAKQPEKTTDGNEEQAEQQEKKTFLNWKAFKEGPYTLYVVSMFFVFMGLWIPYFYVSRLPAPLDHPQDRRLTILTHRYATSRPPRSTSPKPPP